jgi:hypothetical protein
VCANQPDSGEHDESRAYGGSVFGDCEGDERRGDDHDESSYRRHEGDESPPRPSNREAQESDSEPERGRWEYVRSLVKPVHELLVGASRGNAIREAIGLAAEPRPATLDVPTQRPDDRAEM